MVHTLAFCVIIAGSARDLRGPSAGFVFCPRGLRRFGGAGLILLCGGRDICDVTLGAPWLGRGRWAGGIPLFEYDELNWTFTLLGLLCSETRVGLLDILRWIGLEGIWLGGSKRQGLALSEAS